jgi:hypothetical protein
MIKSITGLGRRRGILVVPWVLVLPQVVMVVGVVGVVLVGKKHVNK